MSKLILTQNTLRQCHSLALARGQNVTVSQGNVSSAFSVCLHSGKFLSLPSCLHYASALWGQTALYQATGAGYMLSKSVLARQTFAKQLDKDKKSTDDECQT